MKLLVSVRDCVEAEVVASCNVHVIDLKEPSAGSLGQAGRETAISVAAAIQGRAMLSAAMGELVDYQPHDLDYLQRYDFVKVGLSQIQDMESLRTYWKRWTMAADIGRRAVVVAYADCRLSQSLAPMQLAMFAADVGAPYFLMDTWSKSSGSLLDWISIDTLHELVQLLSANNVGVALAGSLNAHSISRLRQVPVTLIAVRGAACVGGQRNSTIDPMRIRFLLELITDGAAAG